MDASHLMLLGMAILTTTLLLRRRRRVRRADHRRNGRLGGCDANAGGTRQTGSHASVHALEVRLHEFAREIEGRMQTRLTTLERLIDEADREIARLEEALHHAKERAAPANGPLAGARARTGRSEAGRSPLDATSDAALPVGTRQRIHYLREAGYDAEQVAALVGVSASTVRVVLGEDAPPKRDAA